MNILDENIPESQRQLLRSWRIRVRQIGYEVGRQGMKDERIIPHTLHPVGAGDPAASAVLMDSVTRNLL